jgi:hypothetical protein
LSNSLFLNHEGAFMMSLLVRPFGVSELAKSFSPEKHPPGKQEAPALHPQEGGFPIRFGLHPVERVPFALRH